MNDDDHIYKGGLQWGPSLRKGFYGYCSATWPFVTVRVSRLRIRLSVTSWNGQREDEVFEFTKSELRSIRKTGRFLWTAFGFAHDKCDYPNLIRFISMRPKAFSEEVIRLEYHLVNAVR